MNEQVLSSRLMQVGKQVPLGARLADIGSDHAYLPIYLVLKQQIPFAIAGEVVRGPYESAKKQVAKNGLENQIIVRLADGLAAIHAEDQIDAISIAGMGGTLIRNDYEIRHEEILEENQKIYEIIVAIPSDRNLSYSKKELFFGPILLKDRSLIFLQKWQKELTNKQRVLKELTKAQELPLEKIAEVKEQLQWIEEVLA